jgi:Domain of unknown function (DUF4825)
MRPAALRDNLTTPASRIRTRLGQVRTLNLGTERRPPMRGRPVALLALISLALTGCSVPDSGQPAPDNTVDTLWASRTAYVGDNSHVATLVDASGFGPQGDYSLSLQTNTTPYGVTVEYRSLEKPFEDVDFTENATLVLGLVDNLDHVSVTSGKQSYSLTAADASNQLGYDVKRLGQDKAKLAGYLKSSQD